MTPDQRLQQLLEMQTTLAGTVAFVQQQRKEIEDYKQSLEVSYQENARLMAENNELRKQIRELKTRETITP